MVCLGCLYRACSPTELTEHVSMDLCQGSLVSNWRILAVYELLELCLEIRAEIGVIDECLS
jgi:hypothetical protein